jgi:hypothetical protein
MHLCNRGIVDSSEWHKIGGGKKDKAHDSLVAYDPNFT